MIAQNAMTIIMQDPMMNANLFFYDQFEHEGKFFLL